MGECRSWAKPPQGSSLGWEEEDGGEDLAQGPVLQQCVHRLIPK